MLLAALAIPLALGGLARADFSYQLTTTVTGGSLLKMTRFIPGMGKLREPQTSTVMLKGNRLATVSAGDITVIDLDAQTMTTINLEKKTYAVITFEEFKRIVQAAQRKAAGLRDGQDRPAQISFKAAVKESGQSGVVNGHPAREVLLRLEMEGRNQPQDQPAAALSLDSEIWLADDMAGYAEVRRFYERMSQSMDWAPGAGLLGGFAAAQPGLAEGLAELMKRTQKLNGLPVRSVTRMKGMGGMGAPGTEAEAAPRPDETADADAGAVAARRLGGAIGGMLGRRRKQAEAKPAETTPPATAKPQEGVLLETSTDYSNFSAAPVDGARFDVPAGFKQVEHDMKKGLREMER
jgi:hypothetical protein